MSKIITPSMLMMATHMYMCHKLLNLTLYPNVHHNINFTAHTTAYT